MKHRPLPRRRFLQGAATLGAASFAGRGVARAETTNIVRVWAKKDLQVLDPAHTLTDAEDNIMSAIFVKLVAYKGEGKWETEPDAAASIEQVDSTHIKFALRPGIGWSNGFGELTADDVKFSFERIADPANESAYRSDWDALNNVEVTDALSGIIVLKNPFAPLWRTTLPWTAGTIVCKKAVEAVGGRFTTEPPAECGPYRVKAWVPKQKTVLARNPDWTGPRPDFDEIHIFPIDDQTTAESAFEAGELDYVNLPVGSAPRWTSDPLPGTRFEARAMVGLEWIGMNTAYPPFDDVRVRRAVQMAADVDGILEAGFFGVAERATGLVPKGLPGYREQSPYAPRDVDGARRLLAEAGFGEGFKTEIAVLNAADNLTMAQVFQANLAEVGIDVQVAPYESGVFWNLGLESEGDDWKNLQMYLHRWGNGPDPSWTTKWYTCEQVGIWNWERWCNEEYSGLDKAAAEEFDENKRATLYARMANLVDESAAYVLLNYGIQAIAYRDTIVPSVNPDGRRLILPRFRRA